MKDTAKKVLIINEGYSDNLGDQAIKLSMFNLFNKLGYAASFLYYSNPKVGKLPVYNYNPDLGVKKNSERKEKLKSYFLIRLFLSIKNTLKFFTWGLRNKAVIKKNLVDNQYDIVIIGGGQLINTASGKHLNTFSIALYYWVKYINRYSKSPIYIIGVGAASKFKTIERILYKKAVSKINKIWVRDTFSNQTLDKELGVSSEVLPDVAFFTSDAENTDIKIKTTGPQKAIVGIYNYPEYANKFNISNISKVDFYEQWFVVIKDFLEKDIKVSLFYTTRADALESYLFQDYLKTQYGIVLEVEPIKDLKSLYELYQKTDIVYSARMHALLLSLKFKCKPIAYFISQKLSSFTEEYIQSNVSPQVYSDLIEHNFEAYFNKKNVYESTSDN